MPDEDVAHLEAIVIPKAEYEELLQERDELVRLKRQPLDEHPWPWRLGTKLDNTALGQVSLYDGTIEGDGGRPGRWIGVMFSAALGRKVVEAVNARIELESEVRRLLRAWPEPEMIAVRVQANYPEDFPRIHAILAEPNQP